MYDTYLTFLKIPLFAFFLGPLWNQFSYVYISLTKKSIVKLRVVLVSDSGKTFAVWLHRDHCAPINQWRTGFPFNIRHNPSQPLPPPDAKVRWPLVFYGTLIYREKPFLAEERLIFFSKSFAPPIKRFRIELQAGRIPKKSFVWWLWAQGLLYP